MTTMTISIPDSEKKLFTELVKKLNGKVVSAETAAQELKPNRLTLKALTDAHSGKNLGEPIYDVRSFINDL